MGLFKLRRSKYAVSEWRTFKALYRSHQRTMASLGLVLGVGAWGYGLIFDRAGFFGSWLLPVLFGFLIVFGLWGRKHYK